MASRTSSTGIYLLTLSGGIFGCGAPDQPVQSAEAIGEVGEAVIGGDASAGHPAIGSIKGGGCTATLVDPSYLMTSSSCVNFTTGPFNTTADFDPVAVSTTRSYALGASTGDADVAFLRLLSPITSVTPASIATALPANGTTVTFFGFGCQTYPGAGGSKLAFSFPWGATTEVGCSGDSGGPVVLGTETGNGSILSIDSVNGRGQSADVWANAVANRSVLAGVVSFGQSQELNTVVKSLPSWATVPNVHAVSGDFDGDGFGDVALTGPSGWNTIPVAFGNHAGGFNVTNVSVPNFPAWASAATSVVAGDFDHDGDTDIALLGGPGWNTIPVAFSNRNGSFTVTNFTSPNIPGWAQIAGAYGVAGDFDHDGDDDIALLGGSGWNTIPIASSNRNGTFGSTNVGVANFPGWSQTAGAHGVTGDFNADGYADIALSGASGWNSIPVAFSNHNGGFTVTNVTVADFPHWAPAPGVKLVAGDFDGDGDTDIAAAGGNGWRTVAFALSNRSGGFTPANFPMTNFPTWANAAPFVLAGREDKGPDGQHAGPTSDLVLTGGPGWNTMPVALLSR